MIKPLDVGVLYEMAIDPRSGYLSRYRGATLSPEQFQSRIWDGSFAQFVIEHRARAGVIGHVAAYDPHPSNGYCTISVIGSREFAGSGLILEGLAVFVFYLLDLWPFRKIYAEVPGFAYHHFASGLQRYFREEGRLRNHHFALGRWWDVHILALYRELIDPHRDRIVHFAESQGPDNTSGSGVVVRSLLTSLGVDFDPRGFDLTLAEAGIDSLALLEITEALATLGVDVPEELLATLRTVGDLVHYCELYAEQLGGEG